MFKYKCCTMILYTQTDVALIHLSFHFLFGFLVVAIFPYTTSYQNDLHQLCTHYYIHFDAKHCWQLEHNHKLARVVIGLQPTVKFQMWEISLCQCSKEKVGISNRDVIYCTGETGPY